MGDQHLSRGRAGQTVKPVQPYPDSRLCVYLLHLHPHGVCRNGCKLTVVTFLGWSNCQTCASQSRFSRLCLYVHTYMLPVWMGAYSQWSNCQTCAALSRFPRLRLLMYVSSSYVICRNNETPQWSHILAKSLTSLFLCVSFPCASSDVTCMDGSNSHWLHLSVSLTVKTMLRHQEAHTAGPYLDEVLFQKDLDLVKTKLCC